MKEIAAFKYGEKSELQEKWFRIHDCGGIEFRY